MISSRGGMGSHKHGISGHAGKSPRLRLFLRMQAEKEERKGRKELKYSSVKEVFEKEGKKK